MLESNFSSPVKLALIRITQAFSVIGQLFPLLLNILAAIILVSFIIYSNYYSVLLSLPLVYLIWQSFDISTPFRDGRRVEWFRRLGIWKYLVKYYPISLIKTKNLDPSKNYMFCFHPHGVIGVSAFANFATEGNNFAEKFPGITLHPLTLDINLYTPIWRDFLMALGVGPVRKDSIQYKLTKIGPGHSVTVVVGGAIEANCSDPNNPYRLKLKSRKGFVREALKAGTPLVPVFSFGETEMFYVFHPQSGSMLNIFQEFIYRVFRFFPLIFYGKFLMVPLQRPIYTVVGAPLDLPLLPSPTKAEIEFWHDRYIAALKNLFNANKGLYGCPGKELELF